MYLVCGRRNVSDGAARADYPNDPQQIPSPSNSIARAGTGLIAGFYLPPLLVLSAGGLTALMLSGIVARVRIRDPLVAMLPAFAFFCLNLFIAISAL